MDGILVSVVTQLVVIATKKITGIKWIEKIHVISIISALF